MNSPGIDPTDEIPDACVHILEESTDTQLREIIDYAQKLLRDKPSLTDAIESREGEELVRIEDHGAYTLVIAERANETGAARGPFAYRVRWEPEMDDEGGQYKWHYLGRVYNES